MSNLILIIEDNPANMELMVYLLETHSYITLQACDGEVGMACLRRHRPDLVLCDIHMPVLDGYGVLREVRAAPQLQGLTMVAITALAMVGDREKLLAAGFDGYIAKPIEPRRFISQIEAFLPAVPAVKNN